MASLDLYESGHGLGKFIPRKKFSDNFESSKRATQP